MLATIPEIVDLTAPLGSLFMEYNLPYIDNACRAHLYTLTNEYEVVLTITEDTMEYDYLDYSIMSLDIKNIKSGESLHNPLNYEDVSNFWLDEYLSQREQWQSENIEPKFTGNFIAVLNPDNSEGFIKVSIPDSIASEIVNELKTTNDEIMVFEYQGTDSEFINMGIEVFLTDMDYEYSVLMWINKYGAKAIGMGRDFIPVSEKAYDLIVDLLKEEIEWKEGWLPCFDEIFSIELVYKGDSLGTTTDTKDIQEIADILSESKCMVGGSYCPFEAQLIFTYFHGSTSTIRLATDGCSAIVIGSSTYYDFGAGNAEIGDKLEVKKVLLQCFSLVEFPN